MDRLVKKMWSEHRPKSVPVSSMIITFSSEVQSNTQLKTASHSRVWHSWLRYVILNYQLAPLLLLLSCSQTYMPFVYPIVGKTTLAKLVAEGLNAIHNEQAPGCASTPIATSVPMDGYHLSRAQLSAMPDPNTAHHRRGAAFTFDDKAFLELVKTLRITLLPESKIVYAPSFDHAIKDPVADDIPIHPASRIVIFEGNYLSLDQGLWKEAAELMDELWFVEVDFETARTRLLVRHVAAGIAKDEEEAGNRADEIDLVNGRQIVGQRLDVQEVITSKEDESWRPGGQRDPE